MDGTQAKGPGTGWPPWATAAVTVLLVGHMTAVLSAEMVVEPSSVAQKWLFRRFLPYTSLLDLDHAHRYYAPPPAFTPLAVARVHFADGRPDRVVNLPERGTWPRLRYQRQLALAYHLASDFEPESAADAGGPPRTWGASFAHHLCRATPGCSGVTLAILQHRLPPPDRVREAVSDPGAPPLDLDAQEYYSTPETIGDFPCVEP